VDAGRKFKDCLSDTARHFEELVKPLLQRYNKFKTVTSVEANSTEELAYMLDVNVGVDAFFSNSTGMGGLASRIQPKCKKSWNTFTVRKSRESGVKTEYQKRKEAIESGGELFYPYYTMQAYLDEEESLLSFAVAKTEDIIELIDIGECTTKHTGINQNGQAEFYVVSWTTFDKNNKPIFIYKP
jgi:hypothetical protein